MVDLGYNYRLTDMACALGVFQLKKLDSFIKKRRQIVKWYQAELKNVKEVILPPEIKGNHSGWHLYVIRVIRSAVRDKLMAYLKKSGIGANFHYPAVYRQPYYRKLGYKIKLKNEEIYQQSCITLPCYPNLNRSQVKKVAQVIKKYFKYEV